MVFLTCPTRNIVQFLLDIYLTIPTTGSVISNLPIAPLLEVADSSELTVGQRVEFFGLAGRADLNGTFGILRTWDAEAGRWAVKRKGNSTRP